MNKPSAVQEKLCPECHGEGYVKMKVNENITREMAIDAGDLQLEVQTYPDFRRIVCETCGGSGIIDPKKR